MTTPAPIVDHRNKLGELTLDGTTFASQATNVNLTPSTTEDGDPLEVLSGATITADDETTWTLNVTSVQDFNDAAGFIAFALARAGDEIPFTWRPSAAPTSVSYEGTVKVRPVPIGGDVASRLTTSAAWPLVGAPTPTYPGG